MAEDEAFQSISGMTGGSAESYGQLVTMCESYLKRFSKTKRAPEVRTKLEQAQKGKAGADRVAAFEKAVGQAVAPGRYGEARKALRSRLQESPDDVEVLVQLSFFVFGFDTMSVKAYEEAEGYLKKALSADQNDPVAKSIDQENRRLNMALGGSRSGGGGMVIEAGQTAHFAPDGTIASIKDSNGKFVWRWEKDSSLDATVCINAHGVQHVYLAGAGLVPVKDLQSQRLPTILNGAMEVVKEQAGI
jgi:tetratricopeptide (TPR) repeat protein